jgi:hypothetical protein
MRCSKFVSRFLNFANCKGAGLVGEKNVSAQRSSNKKPFLHNFVTLQFASLYDSFNRLLFLWRQIL